MKNKIILNIARVLIFGTLAALAFAWCQKIDRDEKALAAIGECVERTARAQGYHGNAHGLEAWQLFAGECTK